MTIEQSNKQVIRWIFIPLSLVLLAMAGYVSAGPHFGGGKHAMFNPLERMLEHIDLTEQQEKQVEVILSTGKSESGFHKGFSMMRSMIKLNPEDFDYMEKVEKQADLAANKVRDKIIAISQTRKDIYALLTDEQKQELNQKISRKLHRMDKRMSKHDD